MLRRPCYSLPPLVFAERAFSVGTRDGLYEDSVAMAARWSAAGNECELDVYPDAPHGFDAFPMRMADVARDRTLRYLGARLE